MTDDEKSSKMGKKILVLIIFIFVAAILGSSTMKKEEEVANCLFWFLNYPGATERIQDFDPDFSGFNELGLWGASIDGRVNSIQPSEFFQEISEKNWSGFCFSGENKGAAIGFSLNVNHINNGLARQIFDDENFPVQTDEQREYGEQPEIR